MPSDRGAVFATDGLYRYRLWRRANRPGRRLIVIGLNPSIANAERDDPTMRVIMGFADRWGCGRFDMLNMFAFISTDPRGLVHAYDPIGRDNDEHIRATLAALSLWPHGAARCRASISEEWPT